VNIKIVNKEVNFMASPEYLCRHGYGPYECPHPDCPDKLVYPNPFKWIGDVLKKVFKKKISKH